MDSLDAAWRDLEAALPENWYVSDIERGWPGHDYIVVIRSYNPADETADMKISDGAPTLLEAFRVVVERLRVAGRA